MRTLLWTIVIVFLFADGVLNLSKKPNLGQLMFARASSRTRRYGSAAPYFFIAAVSVYLGWFVR